MNRFNKLLNISMGLIPSINDSKAKHVCFILRRNNILSIGTNHGYKSHPWAKKLGHRFNCVHAEMDAILKLRWMEQFTKNDCDLVSIRLSSDSLRYQTPITRIARPCECCIKLIAANPSIKRIYYTDNEGFKEL